jgi:carboxymethylenebutenolidase
MLGGLHAELYRPAGGPPQTSALGLLALPMQGGLTPSMHRLCTWLGNAGFTTLLWDPYSGIPMPDPPPPPGSRVPPEDYVARAEQVQWLDYLEQELGIVRLGVIGWCLGGRMALPIAARDRRLKACVSIYPTLHDPPQPEEIETLAAARAVQCPVQVMYGGHDHITSPASFAELCEALQSRSEPTISHVYPEAEHGFMFEGKRDTPVNARATRLAWPQAISFLKACLED